MFLKILNDRLLLLLLFQTDKPAVPVAVHMEKQALKRAREAFLSGRTRPIEFRLQQLHELQRMVTEKENEICTALKQDINRVSGNPAHCCMQYRNIYFKPLIKCVENVIFLREVV